MRTRLARFATVMACALVLGTGPAFAADPPPDPLSSSVPTSSSAPVVDPPPVAPPVVDPSPVTVSAASAPTAESTVTVACVTDTADVVKVDVPASQAPDAIRALPLENNCDVAAVDGIASIATADPKRNVQYALDNVPFENAWLSENGAGIKVAVIDTGVDSSHPDLSGQVLLGRDYIDNVTSNWTATDPSTMGHGTHVAGIIAALAGNGIGISGAAPGVSILPVRVLGTDGTGLYSNIAAGIDWAVAQGAKVINLSLGGTTTNSLLSTAVANALITGVVVVAAA